MRDVVLMRNINQTQNTYTHKIFQSVLPAIFPWTVKFSNLQTTSDILKVVLSKPNTTSGVGIPNWKETTFFLPSKVSIKSNNIFHFTVQILENKVDYGELPHVIFQPNIFKSALDMILKTIDDLHVCPGINDAQLQTLSYQADSHGSIIDGKIVKSIRSTKCCYMLTNESKMRCQECQSILRSYVCFQKHPSPESLQTKTAHDSHANLSNLSHAELIVRARNLHKMVAQTQRKAKRYYTSYQKEKQKKVEAPKNYNPTSSDQIDGYCLKKPVVY